MFIRFGYEIGIECPQPTPMMTYLSVCAQTRKRIVREKGPASSPRVPMEQFTDAFGNLCIRMVAPKGHMTLLYDAVMREDKDADGRMHAMAVPGEAVPVEALPVECLTYLAASRYCETDRFGALAWRLFGDIEPGSRRVEAICDYVRDRLVFSYGYASGLRTAMEAHEERLGICRDYAHLCVVLCRAMNMPARFVNGFLCDSRVEPRPAPMDFNAWFEVYLADGWHPFDAFRQDVQSGRIPVARGRDAADIPLIQTFGKHDLTAFTIWTQRETDSRLAQPHDDADVSLITPWFSDRWARHIQERDREAEHP